MKHPFLYLLFAVIGFISACEQDAEQFTSDPSAKLRFSADSVVFDTLFTTIGSVSKRLWIYNDDENAVNVSQVKLRNSSSNYELILNGQQASNFENVSLLGNDSIQALVTVNIDPKDENLPFLVNDFIDFTTNGNAQFINLVAWGQDAIFIEKSILACDQVWTADRPYVLLDSVLVDVGCKLIINAGAKIYANIDTPLLIAGELEANGTFDERILFSNVRLDEDYKNAPGQWSGIIFASGSTNNLINCTDIRNAVNGIWLGTVDEDTAPDLVLSNSKIENMSGMGIAAFTSDLYAFNTLVYNCGQFVVANLAGGNYKYEHCTFANYSFDFFRDNPSVVFTDNLPISETEILTDDLSVEMTNTIIWGSLTDELLLNNEGGKNFGLTLTNNIIRFKETVLPDNNNTINEDPKFINPQNYIFHLDTLSPAKDTGFNSNILNDLEGALRDSKPDIGAFERLEE